MRRAVQVLLSVGLSVGLTVGSTLALALALVVATPGAAAAHDVLERTTPADGTSVERLPGAVVLTFSDQPLPLGAQVVVTGPSGQVSGGAPTISGRDVTQAIDPSAPAGDYTVSYRITSDDGHPVSGSFSFHARVGLDGSTATAGPSVHVRPGASAADDARSSSFVPVLLTIVATSVLLAVGGYVVLRGREADRR